MSLMDIIAYQIVIENQSLKNAHLVLYLGTYLINTYYYCATDHDVFYTMP